MLRQLLTTTSLLAAATALLSGCGASGSDRLADSLGDALTADLYAPKVEGKSPTRWTLHPDGTVTLSYGKGPGYSPSLTIREAATGDLCAERAPDWDSCRELDGDAVLLGFEEMNALAVRRAGTELFLSDISLEVPDENFESHEELVAWQESYVDGLLNALSHAKVLSPEEFVDKVTDGKVEKPD
jgi:hypothetical protein